MVLLNILQNLKFQANKPAITIIKKDDRCTLFAVGLLQDQELPDHKTNSPAQLFVLKGTLQFVIAKKSITLNAYDSLEIPMNEVHKVVAREDRSVFLIFKEK